MKRNYVLSCLAGLFGLATSISEAANWTTFRGNMQRTGLCAEPVGKPMTGPLWVDSLGCSIVSSPSIADGRLYIGGRDGNLYCIGAGTGNIHWKQQLGGWLDSSPLLYKGMVFVGSYENRIWMVDGARGDILTGLEGGLQLSSQAITENGTLITGLGAPLEGLGAYDWRLSKKSWDVSLGKMTYSSPAVAGNLCVIATTDGKLHGIDVGQKSACWTFQTQGSGFLSAPAIDNDNVYFAPGNYDHDVYAVDLSTGDLLWKSSGTLVAKRASMKTSKRNMIPPGRFLQLLRLSPGDRSRIITNLKQQGTAIPKAMVAADTGDTTADVWAFFPYGDMKTSSIAVGPENVYVIQKELGYPKPRFSIIAYNKFSGEEAWYFSELRSSAPEAFCSSPVVASGKVFFGWGEGKVYALDERTGSKVWEDSLKGDILSSPAISNGKLYIATLTGHIYAYDLFATADPATFEEGTYCYPNPAKAESRIQYFSEKPGRVEIRILDGAERLLKVHKTRCGASQKDQFIWNLGRVANGVYFAHVRITHDDGTSKTKWLKIAVLR